MPSRSAARPDASGQVPPDVLRVPRLAFPDDQGPPAEVSQCFFVTPVAGDVPGEFLRPERDAGFGRVGVAASRVPVPEAAMDEDGEPVAREDQIGAARKILPVQPEAQAHPVRDAANGALRCGIPPFDACHHFASPLAAHNIGQGDILSGDEQ